MGQRVEGMPAFFNAGVPLQPLVSDTHHPCSATQWRTYYLPCRTSRAIVAHVNSQRTSSSFVDENILKKLYLVSDYQRRLSVWRWEMQWYTHTYQILAFDMEIIHWQHNRDKCIRLHFRAQSVPKGSWYGTDCCFSYGYARTRFFSDYDKRASLQCTVMTENECWISFSVVASETRAIAYNLQIYGEFTANSIKQNLVIV